MHTGADKKLIPHHQKSLRVLNFVNQHNSPLGRSAREQNDSPTITMPQPPYPLHESVRDVLDPEYVEFYNKHIIDKQQVHYQPESASRKSGSLIPGAGPIQKVGSTRDFNIKRVESHGSDVAVRVFTPEGKSPTDGWPATMYFHGGGWVLGNIETENVVASHICSRAKCVVISVDYR